MQEPMIIGVDEAGRGPLAGPVVAAAVLVPWSFSLSGLDDSKKLSSKKREELEGLIKNSVIAWGVGLASVEEIDRLNILQASLLAMRRAIAKIPNINAMVLVDGNQSPRSGHDEWPIIKGDQKVKAISAASILAKEARDSYMKSLALKHPEFEFEKHMGYPTSVHLAALERHGVLACHRKTFGPVAKLLPKTASKA